MPCALLGLGASIRLERVTGQFKLTALATSLKLVAGPVLGYAAARLAGMDEVSVLIVTIYMACPTAIASYVLADQLKSDGVLAGSAVVFSTLMAILSLATVLYLFAST